MAVIVLTGGGCSQGPRLYPVSGHVQFTDGTPVTFGNVECISQVDRRVSRGAIARDGSFQLGTHRPGDGAVAGRHQVIVVQSIIPMGKEASHRGHAKLVPRRYGQYATSDLTLDVIADQSNDQITIRLDP
jgi:hypothetical protein